MSHVTGTATGHADLLDRLHAFLIVGHPLTPVYTYAAASLPGALTGLAGKAASVQETITATFSSATAFSVAGSITGSLGSGTTGTPFTSSVVDFTIPTGSPAWQSGDTVAFIMTLPWVAQRAVTGSEYIWKAPGNDGAGAIYVGAREFNNVAADYYNWQLGGFTGYSAGVDFGQQPGSMANSTTLRSISMALWNSSIPYWFVADGRSFEVIAKVSTVYEHGGAGLIDCYGSPGQFPYPLAVWGSMAFASEPASTSASWRWSNTSVNHRAAPWGSGQATDLEALRLKRLDGYWRGFNDGAYITGVGSAWPFANAQANDLRPALDGSYQLIPIVLSEDQGAGTVNTYGELPRTAMVPGFGNGAENTVTLADGMLWLVIQNIFRTTKTDYIAIRLT